MQHRRTKWVWTDGFSSGVWKWECLHSQMSAGREFQVGGAATEKVRRASLVCMRGTTSVGVSEERRVRGGACVFNLVPHICIAGFIFIILQKNRYMCRCFAFRRNTSGRSSINNFLLTTRSAIRQGLNNSSPPQVQPRAEADEFLPTILDEDKMLKLSDVKTSLFTGPDVL